MIDDMWEFQDGTVVVEEEENHLPVFAVYDKHDNVVRCYPPDRKDAEDCMEALDNGENPITAGWEDGRGNLLSDLMGGMGKSDYTEILQDNMLIPRRRDFPGYIVEYEWDAGRTHRELYDKLEDAISDAKHKTLTGEVWVQVRDPTNGNILYYSKGGKVLIE